MASGLIALVDDCIKSRWHQKSRVHITIPKLARSPLKMNMEYAGPKHLIEDVFKAARRQLADPLPLHGRQPANIDVGLGC